MYKYEDTHTNVSGTFPNTLAINVTTPGAGDGTEYIAAQVNDNWGFHQALMDYANLIPDSVTEAPGTSQMVEAMRVGFGHPGEVVGWHGQDDPATLTPPPRFLLLQGQGILRANYPLLDAAVYCGDGNNPTWDYYYHADDAAGTSRNPSGIYLILPEARGLCLRGDDPTNINDPNGSIRKFPDYQRHAVEQHGHELKSLTSNFYAVHQGDTYESGTDKIWVPSASAGADRLMGSSVTTATIDPDETRTKNLQVKWCVRY